MKKGKLICLEGIDGSGKNTQAQILAKKFNAIVLSFPNYSTETGKYIKAYLNRTWYAVEPKGIAYDCEELDILNAYILQSLMTMNRLECLNTIMHYINNGKNVILDRYYASAIVYGQCDGLPKYWLEEIHKTLPRPDMWIFIDTPVAESFKRRPERKDDYESDPTFLTRARNKYLELFKEKSYSDPTWLVVSGEGTEEEVTDRISHILECEIVVS